MIVEELIAISFLFTIAFGVVIAQVIALSRIFQSWAWYLLAIGMGLIGALRVWSALRLPAAILKAQTQGQLPTEISVEQWLVIGMSFTAVGFLILAFDRLRRDLRRIQV